MARKIAFIYDENLTKECDRLPVVLNRASIVQDLINSYELLKCETVTVIPNQQATEDELKLFHSSSYVEFLKKCNECKDLELHEDEAIEYGLGYDCALLTNMYDLVRTIAGSSLTGAKLLNEGTYDVIINWFGGWHHAQRDEAEGFCYVNDVVLAIQKLTENYSKILYVDLDIHHGNGVQNAFELSKKVLTLSIHKYSIGFYPGTGSLNEYGCHKGKYYSLNVPLLEGCSDATYLKCFKTLFPRILETFQPEAMVIQCGADCLNGDPIGESNVTPNALCQCIQDILNCKLPTLFLGGGGYNFSNTARYWTLLTSLILEKRISNNIPDCSENFTLYKPSYELEIDPGNQKDCNSDVYIDNILLVLLNYCNNIVES